MFADYSRCRLNHGSLVSPPSIHLVFLDNITYYVKQMDKTKLLGRPLSSALE